MSPQAVLQPEEVGSRIALQEQGLSVAASRVGSIAVFDLKPLGLYAPEVQIDVVRRRRDFLIAAHGDESEFDVELLAPDEVTTATHLTLRAIYRSEVRRPVSNIRPINFAQSFLNGQSHEQIADANDVMQVIVAEDIQGMQITAQAILKKVGKVGITEILKDKLDNRRGILSRIYDSIPDDLTDVEAERILEKLYPIYKLDRIKTKHGKDAVKLIERFRKFAAGFTANDVAQLDGLTTNNNFYMGLKRFGETINSVLSEEERQGLLRTKGDFDTSPIVARIKRGMPTSKPHKQNASEPETSKVESINMDRLYGKETGRVPLLNAQEEVELAKRIEAGLVAEHKLKTGYRLPSERIDEYRELARDGEEAKKHLTEANLRLVIYKAKFLQGRGLSMDDLIQEGNLGLMHGVKKFDYKLGNKFSTYAGIWIKAYMDNAIDTKARNIHIPQDTMIEINRIKRVEKELEATLGGMPTESELAHQLDFEPDKLADLRKLSRQILSLDTPVGENDTTPFGELMEDADVVEPYDMAEQALIIDGVNRALQLLPKKERTALKLIYGGLYTKKEIASKLGISTEVLRRIHTKSLHILEEMPGIQDLEELVS